MILELLTNNLSDANIILLGFPYDMGCIINNGHKGSNEGPDSFLKSLDKIGPTLNLEFDIDLRDLIIYNYGNINNNLSLQNAHKLLTDTISTFPKYKIPFVIGGSNDQSYYNWKGLYNIYQEDIDVININAYLGINPCKNNNSHSGTPFRELLEDPNFKGQLFEFAVQGAQNDTDLYKYTKSKGAKILWLSQIITDPEEEFRKILDQCKSNHIFVSFDIDSIKGSDAPGVSYPSPIGLSAENALRICYHSGLSPKVRMIDVSELNPEIENYRTPKLVAMMFYYFLLGYKRRIIY
jgi:formiminoglutamase